MVKKLADIGFMDMEAGKRLEPDMKKIKKRLN